MQQITYLTDRQIAERYGVSRCTPWRWVKAGGFPKPVQLSAGCTRWRADDIRLWEEKTRE